MSMSDEKKKPDEAAEVFDGHEKDKAEKAEKAEKIIANQENRERYNSDLQRFETCIAQDKMRSEPGRSSCVAEKLAEYECPAHTALGLSVAIAAFDIFQGAGCSADFCFQDVTEEPSFCSIFGGFNRLRFSSQPRKGMTCWDYSKSHCTDDFIAHCESLGISAS